MHGTASAITVCLAVVPLLPIYDVFVSAGSC